MKLKKKNSSLLILLVITLFVITNSLFSNNSEEDYLKELEGDSVINFIQEQNTTIELVSKEKLKELLESPYGSFYAGLPDEEFVQVLTMDENFNGYLIFIRENDSSIISKRQVHNFRLI